MKTDTDPALTMQLFPAIRLTLIRHVIPRKMMTRVSRVTTLLPAVFLLVGTSAKSVIAEKR